MKNTQDLSQFGHREREEVGLLLSTLNTSKDDTKLLGDGVTVEFNRMSGYVFLVDKDYNVAMMSGNKLVDFITCPNCGHEETRDDFEEYAEECCKEYFEEIK